MLQDTLTINALMILDLVMCIKLLKNKNFLTWFILGWTFRDYSVQEHVVNQFFFTKDVGRIVRHTSQTISTSLSTSVACVVYGSKTKYSPAEITKHILNWLFRQLFIIIKIRNVRSSPLLSGLPFDFDGKVSEGTRQDCRFGNQPHLCVQRTGYS